MAKIADLIVLIERGWPPHLIRQKLEIKPYRLAQMLSSPTVQNMVANNQRLTRLASQYRACRHVMYAVDVLRQVLRSTNVSGETGRKAAGQMLRVAGCSGWQVSAGERLRRGPDPMGRYVKPRRRSRRQRGAVVRQTKPSNHVPAEAGVSGGKDNAAASLGCADHGSPSMGDQNSAQNSAQVFRTFPHFSEGGREGRQANPQVNQELREKEGALVPPENAGETRATQQDAGKMPATQQDTGETPVPLAGETPATQQDTGKMPATQQDAGKMPATQQDAGKMPVPREDAGKMPATQQDAGKMPATHEEGAWRQEAAARPPDANHGTQVGVPWPTQFGKQGHTTWQPRHPVTTRTIQTTRPRMIAQVAAIMPEGNQKLYWATPAAYHDGVVKADPSSSLRRGILAVVMLAVLLAAAGVAYLLQSYTARRAQAGAAVMGAIRANGLGHYWSDQPSTAWYTINEQGKPIGWRLEYRIPIEGGFAGVSVTGIATRQGIVVPVASRWQLSNDLNTGKYQSFVLHEDGRIITEIELSQEQVKVRRGVLIGVTAEAWQPWRQFPLSQTEGNYVPEGTLWLVIAQVAALRAEGGFSLIFDEEADMRQTFLRYAGEVAQDGKRYAKVLGSSMVMGRKSAEEYLLSEEGVVFQIGADREAQAMSDYASILKQFGDPLPMVQPWLWPDMRGSPQIPDAGGAIGDSDR